MLFGLRLSTLSSCPRNALGLSARPQETLPAHCITPGTTPAGDCSFHPANRLRAIVFIPSVSRGHTACAVCRRRFPQECRLASSQSRVNSIREAGASVTWEAGAILNVRSRVRPIPPFPSLPPSADSVAQSRTCSGICSPTLLVNKCSIRSSAPSHGRVTDNHGG